ncbi:MAG: hypothetical protein SFV15_00285 [Polyangiaceae bacterium]|nr:hypothetical protein [Polyangiaceae bacterium]
MAVSSLLVRNAPWLLALGLGIVAASQGCSPGTLDYPEDFEAEALKYGTGGGGMTMPPKTGGGPAVGSGGGGGAVKADADFYPVGCDIPKTIMTCTLSACHQGPMGLGKPFDMKTMPFWSQWLDKPASHENGFGAKIPAGCPSPPALLVNSTSPAESWILKKVNGTHGTCGTQMPDGGLMDATAKKCIQDWIMNIATKGKQ